MDNPGYPYIGIIIVSVCIYFLCILTGGKLTLNIPVHSVNPDSIVNDSEVLGSEVLKYIEIIKQKYQGMPIVKSEWAPQVGRPYFGKLVLVTTQSKTDYYGIQRQNSESLVSGDIDTLVARADSRADLIDISDIIDNEHLYVIIDGPPGIGKTTLCRKLCNMWAEGSIKKNYQLFLYLRLCDEKVQLAKNLRDLCEYVYKSPKVEAVVKWFIDNEGQNLLFIFDEWDVLSETAKQESFAGEVINRKVLANSSVIVTSRRYASSSLPMADIVVKHVEIFGFKKSEIKNCIKETLREDPVRAENLIKELQICQDVQSLCYVPYVCSLVIFVYQKLEGVLPTTLTELYEKFVIYTVQREFKKRPYMEPVHMSSIRDSYLTRHLGVTLYEIQRELKKETDKEPAKISSIKDHHIVMDVGFQKICHFAYINLAEETPKMTFSTEQVQEHLPNAHRDNFFGLITRFTFYDDHDYQFLHRIIQEFLAAWWISIQDNTVELFDKYYNKKHFRMCLTFVAGLTGLKDVNHSHHFTKEPPMNVSCIRQPHFGFSAYRHNSFHKNKSVYFTFGSNGIDNSHCHDISNQPEYIDVFTFQLLYESQNQDLCQTFTKSIKSSLCSRRLRPDCLTLFDTLCLRFFLCQSNSLWHHLDLRGFGGSQLSLLVDGLSELTHADNCKIRILELDLYSRHNPVNVDLLTKLLRSPISCTLRECYITARTNELEDLPKFFNLLKSFLKLKNLKVIQFAATWLEPAHGYYSKTIGESAFQELQDLLKSSSLNEMLIQIIVNYKESSELFTSDFISLVNSIISGIAKSSMESFSLYLLDKSSYKKGEHPVISNEAITSLLNDSQTLQHLSLQFPDRLLKSLEISEVKDCLTSLKVAREPGQLKKCLPHIVKDLHCLIRQGVISNDEIRQLNFIHPNLQVLAVTVDNEDNTGMLFTCLQTNTSLKALRVRFHKDTFSSQDVCNAFEAMLCHNKTMECLEIDHSQFKTISSTYQTHLVRGLQHNLGIQQLRTPIPLPMTDLNTIFIDKKDITHLHLDLKRSSDEVKVKGDIFLDHTIPLLKDLIEKHNTLYILKMSGSAIEERPKYQNNNVQRFWQTVLHQPTLKFLIMKSTPFMKYNLRLVKEKEELVLPVCPVIDWIV